MVGAGASWRSVTKFIICRQCHSFENGVQNNAARLRAERAEIFWVSTPNCDMFEVH